LPLRLELTSARNERVKLLRRLVSDSGERRRTGLCVVEGTRVATEAATSALRVAFALVSPRLDDVAGGAAVRAALESALADRPADLLLTSDSVLDAVSDTRAPQGVMIALEAPRKNGLPSSASGPCLVAWELQDPGNVGTLVRAAEAFGAAAVIVAAAPGGPLIDAFSPRAVRASAGSCLRVPVHEWREDAGTAARALSASGWRPVACVTRAGALPESLDLRGDVALVVGSEAHGVADELASACDARATFPLSGAVESINAAMAGTALLAEAARQRRSG
jgi:TrmH family RNA methyltransferase